MREKNILKEKHPVLVEVLATVLGAIAGAIVTFGLTRGDVSQIRKDIVAEMSNAFSVIDENMSFEEALEKLKKEYEEAKKDIDKKQSVIDNSKTEISNKDEEISVLNQKVTELEEKIDGLNNNIFFSTPTTKKNGEELLGVYDSVLIYGGDKSYFSEELLKKIFTDEEFVYNGESVQFNFTIEAIENAYHESGKGIDIISFIPVHADNDINNTALIDNSGVSHTRSLYTCYTSRANYIEYKIDKKYRYFECEFFIPSEATSVEESNDRWNHASIVITDQDGNIICQKSGVNRRTECEKSGLIDISNTEYIRFTFNNTDCGINPLIAIGNPTLYE